MHIYIYTVGGIAMILIEQTGLTSVRVSWIPISELSVIGYTVHYLLAGGHGGNGTKIVTADTTSTEITGLIYGGTYIFSVVANSTNIFPGASEKLFTLGMITNIVQVHTSHTPILHITFSGPSTHIPSCISLTHPLAHSSRYS